MAAVREAVYECGDCNAFFGMWGPHCPDCGAVAEDQHECRDCPGWPDHYILEIREGQT